MAYEKKIEPLTKFEAFMYGFTLILYVVILGILPWANTSLICDEEMIKLDVSSFDDVETFHNCVKDSKSMYLFGATCLLLGYPIILSHIHYARRVYETMYACWNIGLFETLYLGSWFIVSTIYCVVLPALLIFIVYYEWEFADEHEYLGYAIQFQLACFVDILFDCVIIPMGFTAFLPWFTQITSMLGYNKSAYYDASSERFQPLISNHLGCRGAVRVVMIFVCLIFALIGLIGSFLDVFDYDKEGFFSYHGDSQWLFIIIFISWIVQGLQAISIACNLDKVKKMLDDNVVSIPLSKRENESSDISGGSGTQVAPVVPEIDVDEQEEQDDAGL